MFRKEPVGELETLAEKYNMSDLEYCFLKEYFKLSPSVRENFFETLDTMFSAIHENSKSVPAPENSLEDLSDEEIIHLYRQGKQSEKEAEGKSEVS